MKSYSIKKVASFFSDKIKMIPAKLGERGKSANVKKIGNQKIYNLPCKTDLVSYINNFKNNLL